jgi:serine/threonine-protein phosphatase 2A activator
LLFDISGAKSWQKVNEGMIKMFRAEVLSKLPIMAHFLFGSLLSLDIQPAEHDECCEDEHEHETGADKPLYRVQSCCVQRIPSAIAAKDFKN